MSATNFKTENNTYRKLIGNGLTYRIPRFQRDYSWSEDEWEDLWADILGILQEGGEPAHYMGYLVLQSQDDKSFDVIDGQQRLTTLTLVVLAAMKNLQRLVNDKTQAEQNQRRIDQIRQTYIGYLDPVTLVSRTKLTLNRNNDSYFQTYLVPLGHLPQRGFRASEHSLRKAFEWFEKRVRDYAKRQGGDEGMALASLVETMSDKLFFTVISVTDELNSTGLEGVTFAVSNERTGITQTVTTDAAGNVLLTDLDKSTTYHIREQQTLENYRLDNTDYTMTVAADGRIDGLSTAALSITNRMLRVSIHAVDMVLRSDTADEQLSLYNAQDQLIQTWTTNGSGEMFTDLTEGSYYVVRGKADPANARKYPFTVQDTASTQNWTVPVFTLRSAVALAVLAVVAAGVVWLLVFLWGILARRRKARKAAAAQDETLDQSENKS